MTPLGYSNKNVKKSRNLLRFFSRNQLILNYVHIGVKSNHLYQSYKRAILGYYRGVSIINPDITLYNLKLVSNFLYSLLLKNKVVGFIFSGMSSRVIAKNLDLCDHYYILNSWPKGLLTNAIDIKRCWKLKRVACRFPNFPSALVALNLNPSGLFNLNKEARFVGIPLFCFADCIHDLDLLDYWIPTNLASGRTRLFWLNYLNLLLHRSKIHRKKFFRTRSATYMHKLVERFLREENLDPLDFYEQGYSYRSDSMLFREFQKKTKLHNLLQALKNKRKVNWVDAPHKVIIIRPKKKLIRSLTKRLGITFTKVDQFGRRSHFSYTRERGLNAKRMAVAKIKKKLTPLQLMEYKKKRTKKSKNIKPKITIDKLRAYFKRVLNLNLKPNQRRRS